jgi:hypothetical protein
MQLLHIDVKADFYGAAEGTTKILRCVEKRGERVRLFSLLVSRQTLFVNLL